MNRMKVLTGQRPLIYFCEYSLFLNISNDLNHILIPPYLTGPSPKSMHKSRSNHAPSLPACAGEEGRVCGGREDACGKGWIVALGGCVWIVGSDRETRGYETSCLRKMEIKTTCLLTCLYYDFVQILIEKLHILDTDRSF